MSELEQPTEVGSSTTRVPTWSVASLGVIVLWLAVLLGLVNHYGLIGVQFGLIFAACTAYFLSRLPYRLIPYCDRVWNDLVLFGMIAYSLGIGVIVDLASTPMGRVVLLDWFAMGATVLIWRSTIRTKLVVTILSAIVYGLLIRLQLYELDHLVGSLIRGLLLAIVMSVIDRWRLNKDHLNTRNRRD